MLGCNSLWKVHIVTKFQGNNLACFWYLLMIQCRPNMDKVAKSVATLRCGTPTPRLKGLRWKHLICSFLQSWTLVLLLTLPKLREVSFWSIVEHVQHIVLCIFPQVRSVCQKFTHGILGSVIDFWIPTLKTTVVASIYYCLHVSIINLDLLKWMRSTYLLWNYESCE